MVQLSLADLQIIRDLRAFGVLIDVDPGLINQSNGICIVPCADGDQIDDIYRYHRNIILIARETPRIHLLSAHGGALIIPPSSPLNRNHRGENLLEDISSVPGLKDIHTVVSYAHAPCGICGLFNISILQQIAYLKEADAIIQKQLPHLQALSFFQADMGKNRKRTYFVSGTKWREWQQIYRPRG